MVKHLQNIISVNNKEWLCQSCNKYLKKNKIPLCAVTNGMKFPKKPDFFDLNELECRLIAPRIAFQKIMQAPRGKQVKINGNVVNVPADVTNTVNMLPRLPEQTGTIKVQLKRKLQYKSSALSLNVRLHKVFQAAVWLSLNSDLYREQGVTLDQNWVTNFSTDNSKMKKKVYLRHKITLKLFKLNRIESYLILMSIMISGVKMNLKYLQVLLIQC